MLAYTPSAEYGERDRTVRTKPGRYLNKFFSDVLTKKQIAYYAEWWVRGQRPKLLDLSCLPVGIAMGPDDIADVYVNGPESCMDGSYFSDPEQHPARIYGAGDLGVAFLRKPSGDHPEFAKAPDYIARALVWPEKKVVGRVYPSDEGNRNSTSAAAAQEVAYHLLAELRKQGYRSVYEHGWVLFEGMRKVFVGQN